MCVRPSPAGATSPTHFNFYREAEIIAAALIAIESIGTDRRWDLVEEYYKVIDTMKKQREERREQATRH
jgi:hypothetical protein